MSHRLAVPLLLALALAGCAGQQALPFQTADLGTGDAKLDAAVRDACRQRANQVYERQYRAEIFSPSASVNAPASGGYDPTGSTQSLSRQFAYDQMMRECLRTATVSGERRAEAAETSSPLPVPPRPPVRR